MKKEVVFYLVRHGETMFNVMGKVQGWSDTPLTDNGRKISLRLGKRLSSVHFMAACCSDAGRARETAQLVLEAQNSQVRLFEDPALREVCFGSYEGDSDLGMWTDAAQRLGLGSAAELMEKRASVGLEKIIKAFKAPDQTGLAEDFKTVKARMQKALHSIAVRAEKEGGGSILVVSHGMSLLVMLSDMTDNPAKHTPLLNASVSMARFEQGRFVVESIGDMRYITKV